MMHDKEEIGNRSLNTRQMGLIAQKKDQFYKVSIFTWNLLVRDLFLMLNFMGMAFSQYFLFNWRLGANSKLCLQFLLPGVRNAPGLASLAPVT